MTTQTPPVQITVSARDPEGYHHDLTVKDALYVLKNLGMQPTEPPKDDGRTVGRCFFAVARWTGPKEGSCTRKMGNLAITVEVDCPDPMPAWA